MMRFITANAAGAITVVCSLDSYGSNGSILAI